MKKLMMVSMMAFLLPGVASAVPFGKIIGEQLEGLRTKPAGCTDFTGNWEGKCRTSTESADASTEIKQYGCHGIVQDGQFVPIGGMVSHGVSGASDNGDAYGVNLGYTAKWDAKKKKLHGSVVGLMSGISSNPADDGAFKAKSVTRIENGKLISAVKFDQENIVCEYTKVY